MTTRTNNATCICRGTKCRVCTLIELGGPMAGEFKAGAFGVDDATGEEWGVVYDLRGCTCPPCHACYPHGTDHPAEMVEACEWSCF